MPTQPPGQAIVSNALTCPHCGHVLDEPEDYTRFITYHGEAPPSECECLACEVVFMVQEIVDRRGSCFGDEGADSMKPLVGRCNYDLNGYSHRQFWRLVRDLTSCGWTVTIQAQEDRRPPWGKQTKPDAFWCYVKNPGFDVRYASPPRIGRTAWEALKKAVEEVVNPAESGTANAVSRQQ